MSLLLTSTNSTPFSDASIVGFKQVNVCWVTRSLGQCTLLFTDTVNPLSANTTKWLNTLIQFVGNSRRIVLSMFDHFVVLALEGLRPMFPSY